MNIRFWPPPAKDEQSEGYDPQQEQLEAVNARPIHRSLTQLSAQFRSFIQNNLPRDFDRKLTEATPFLISSIIMWPGYWLYRGLDWAHQRPHISLNSYIHKTYVQAKCVQLAIYATAFLIYSTRNHRNRTNILDNLKASKYKS